MDEYDPIRMPANQRARSEEEAYNLGLRLYSPQDIVADAEQQVRSDGGREHRQTIDKQTHGARHHTAAFTTLPLTFNTTTR